MLVPAPGDVDNAISTLLAEGVVMSGPIVLQEMKPSHCHENVGRAWQQRFKGLISLCTGYALSTDGLWRQHWWGLLDGGVLETTVPRETYFGIAFPSEMLDELAPHLLEGGGPA